jgi:exodeoxyribonuclease-3
MKLYSWNVNGFRAVIKKGFWEWFTQAQGDVVCLQEIKAHPEQISKKDRDTSAYQGLWNPATVKKGYSGVAVYSAITAQSIDYELPEKRFQGEGRLIQMEFEYFYFFNVYFPNGQMSDERLQYKLEYYDSFLSHVQSLRKHKPIVVCGDFNTAHKEIDLKNPKANEARSGFLPIERAWLDTFIAHGYIDTFRMFTKDPGHYTWWTYRFNARANNAGWRIDYFFVSDELQNQVKNAWIEPEVQGSDHCPIGLELAI